MNYILASSSPRRKELMEQAGFVFEILVSDTDENIQADSPSEMVMELAYRKAENVFQKRKDTTEDITVIGADTVVSYRGEILGKPADEEEAMAMLSLLADRTHQVYTGVCLIRWKDGQKSVRRFCECTQVSFYPVTREELKSYIRTGDPMDKAGAYGIQGPFAVHVKGIEGDYNNVVGLPIARLYQELKKMDWTN